MNAKDFIKSKDLVGVNAHVYTTREGHETYTLIQLIEEFERQLFSYERKEPDKEAEGHCVLGSCCMCYPNVSATCRENGTFVTA